MNILILSAMAFALTPKTNVIVNKQLKMSCAGQLMSFIGSAHNGPFKTPVISDQADEEIGTLMDSLGQIDGEMQKNTNRSPDPKTVKKVQDIYAKGGTIIEKFAPKEMQLCMDASLSMFKECSSIIDMDPKAQQEAVACARKAHEKPEIKQKFTAFIDSAKKRFLVRK